MAPKLFGKLKRAVKKIKLLLDFNLNRWKVASLIGVSPGKKRRLNFNVSRGLKGFIEDSSPDFDEPRSRRELHRTQSYPVEEIDIDRRADAFIANFKKQLLYERQVSLQLRYITKSNSFDSVTSP